MIIDVRELSKNTDYSNFWQMLIEPLGEVAGSVIDKIGWRKQARAGLVSEQERTKQAQLQAQAMQQQSIAMQQAAKQKKQTFIIIGIIAVIAVAATVFLIFKFRSS